ncbi:hypothetical protein B0O99DRAFT_510779 [Bisporella sp. PMI_857]|nr:hypothetical protein B0O99DRAFT_510779 [Bisporella sp. PMI_857]
MLLAWASHPEDIATINSRFGHLLYGAETRPKHLELPLLRTVHETDLINFARRDDFEIKLQEVKLPMEIVDDGMDEDAAMLAGIRNTVRDFMNKINKEKLAVTQEPIALLQKIMKSNWSKEDERQMWDNLCPYKNKIFEQDVPTPIREARARKEETSSDTVCEVMQLEKVYSPLASIDNRPTSPAMASPKHNPESLKVEEILTPPRPTPLAKSVHFSEIVETMSRNTPDFMSNKSSPSLVDEVLTNLFGDAGKKAMRQVEQETLIQADTTARVKVPVMDFSPPDPPWMSLQRISNPEELLSRQTNMINDYISADIRTIWPLHKQAKLKWNPFPHDLARVVLEENFSHNDEVWEVFVREGKDEGLIEASSLTWKPPGLKILDDSDSDDDEIEPGKFLKAKPQDIAFLVKKRKMEIEEQKAEARPAPFKNLDPFELFPIHQPPRPNALKPKHLTKGNSSQHEDPNEGDMGLLLGGAFSAEAALDNFMEIRGAKKHKLTNSSYFVKSAPAPAGSVQIVSQQALQHTVRQSPLSAMPLPRPVLRLPDSAAAVIISSSLLKNRALVKSIEKHYQGIRLVERDFTAHNTVKWVPGSVTRSPVASSLTHEADIIISPSVGIITTTLQQIKQKALPGQKSKVAIRDRIEKVSLRYEKLVVLVTEGLISGQSEEIPIGLDINDCKAFSDFMGFTSGLECTVTVHLVSGGIETVSTWLISIIVQNAAVGWSELLDDETHWEVFLRRAGMNAFAAQAIIANMKAPAGVDSHGSAKAGLYGLTGFMEMGPQQRLARFGPLCGVKSVQRVSAVLDIIWQ